MTTFATRSALSLPDFPLTSAGQVLDTSQAAFGALTDSSDIAFDGAALRQRMAQDGYLYLPGLLNREEVRDARRLVVQRLSNEGWLKPDSDPMDCLVNPGVNTGYAPHMAFENQILLNVLYNGPMMALWERFFAEPVRHFDFTWFRATSPGNATNPHTDAVYMNRGTHDLYTAWTPFGDVPIDMGGLMVLEGSHNHQKLRENYSMKDVDAFCENRKPNHVQMGGGGNIREGGWLSNHPATLRERLGGRWLTANYQMGDVLVFSIFTVHCSLDNKSEKMRLTSDSRYQRASEPADERWIGESPVGHGPEGKRGMIC